ncbi:MAG: 16S rRNA (guanine(527)-N(7))-methyltransferase RsmG [Desulfovibrio sp.]
METHELIKRAKKLGCNIQEDQAILLNKYLETLTKYNSKINLVGPHDPIKIFDTLFVDSLYLAPFMKALELPDELVTYDLGAGAGLPGIPLRCIWQQGEYHLVEIRQKRTTFMKMALAQMKLMDTRVFCGRAEETEGNLPAPQVILSRAFMPWEKLCEFIRPMFAGKGILVILSNDPVPEALPAGYTLLKTEEYPAAGGKRHFWALAYED